MAKILNLDTIEQASDKEVILNGVTHPFHPFTVAEFIQQVKEVETIEKAGTVSPADYVELSIKTITRAFPTIPEDQLRALSLDKLRAIGDFVRSVAEEEAAPNQAETTPATEGETGNVQGAAS